ncbi:MAG: hypothetical protein MJ058_08960 [Akkermansia sp.]|nr:hypothetical protein [Akkermansia sp.]
MKFRLSTLAVSLCAAAGLFAAPLAAQEQENYPAELVRMGTYNSEQEEVLQVPLATYADAQGRQIDLVGAIHIADPSYYADLNTRFATYDKVLYEMVDGGDLPRMLILKRKVDGNTATDEEKAEYEKLRGEMKERKEDSILGFVLNFLYDSISTQMNLQMQSEGIDYGKENFVFADVTQEELSKAMQDSGESWLGLIVKSMISNIGELDLMTLLNPDPKQYKHMMMEALAKSSQSDSVMEQSSIVVARNAKCFEVLEGVLKDPAAKRIAIFYGAMHLREMDERLKKMGYTLQKVEWLNAVSAPVPTPAPAVAPAPAPAPAPAAA